MSFQIADMINGRNLYEGAPVVAFIVNAQGGHYPLQDNPNAFGNRPSHFFAIESFPIFAVAAEGAAIEVADESQLSVRLALQLTGTTSWDDLSKTAFNSRRGVRLLGRQPNEARPGDVGRRVYGLAVMHRDTYNHLISRGRSALAASCACDGYAGEYRKPADKASDIQRVLELLTGLMQCPANIWSRPAGAEVATPEEFRAGTNLWRICALSADAHLRQEMMPDVELPPLMYALDSSDGQQLGADFREQLRHCDFLGQGLLKSGHLAAADVPDLAEFLELLWDCVHLRTRMYEIHAHFYPSFYAGQDSNYPSVLEMARATLEDVWREFTDNHLEYETGNRVHQLAEELARTEATVIAMRAQLAAATKAAASR